ncbi:MAG: DUF3098 domain-containing protein [Prevotellaceae bacterium]|nr:DUF3098 domain-containing protein [Prevotellaceae bacterium]
MDKNFAFGKMNYILMMVGFLIVVLGFVLMTGAPTTEEAFNPDIFSTRRIVVAPLVALFGFLFVIVAIMWKPKEETTKSATEETKEDAPYNKSER